MVKKIVGYGIKYENETLDCVIKYYFEKGFGIYKTKREALERVKESRQENPDDQKEDIRIFKILIEME